MLLTRFWYIILAVIAAAGASAALLSLGVINRQGAEHVGDELRRDRTDLDAILRLEARARLDRIAFISVDNKLGAVLKQASGAGSRDAIGKFSSEAKDAMNAHVSRLLEASDTKSGDSIKPDIAFAVDINGRIVAQLGPLESNPAGSSLATYPFIARALRGYVRDDVIVYDRRVYRMASRPVLYGGEYVGAIAHGYRFDDEFAKRVASGLGDATVLFFYGRTPLASSMATGAPQVAEVAAILPEALTDKHLQEGERIGPMPLQAGGRAVYSLMVGGAAQAEVGYAIARALPLIASPLAFFQSASREDVHALPLPWLGVAAVLLAMIGLTFVYFERDRPYKVLRQKVLNVASGERERLLVTEWRGAYRALADAINQALDKAVERAAELAPSSKKKANLDEILGPTPDSHVEPYFGFADAGPPPGKTGGVPINGTGPTKTGGTPIHGTGPTPKQESPQLQAAAPAAAPPAAKAAAAAKPAMAGVAAPAGKPPLAAPKAAAIPLQGSNDNADTADQANHFREVYQQYLSVRKDCGEAVDGLSYEKFELTLTKTRDQVLQKHPAKDVRFTVYVKEGKAALKAAPVKR
ncbi:MAG TPA: MXAN_5187 family protein [Polyangiales bacterium]|nr:MXAN_5187 family protein [Polyangiales bacterium]